MKRITLLLTLLALSSLIIAQNAAIKKKTLSDYNQNKAIAQNHLKDGGDVVWSEDFDGGLPETWNNVDLSDENMPWYWTTDSVFGAFTQGFIESETAENGFMVMNADGYNTVPQFDPNGVESPNLVDVDAYIQTPFIDLSAMTNGVILEFHHQYRYFTGMWYGVEVSKDYDPENPNSAHWSLYQTNTGVGIGDPPQDESYQINISEVAAGQENVVIRWYAHSSDAYFWSIDDVKILEPYLNNMILTESWSFYGWENEPPSGSAHASGYLQHGGFYAQIPQGQEEAFVGFRAAVQNFGINDQANVILTTEISYSELDTLEKEVVYSVATYAKDIDASVIDSLITDANYTPTEYGYYDIDLTVSSDDDDEFIDDNIDHREFILNDSTYTRVTDNVTSSVATRNWVGGGKDGDGLGVLFTLVQTAEVEAMKWQFHSRNNNYSEHILNAGYVYICRIFGYNDANEDWETSPIISSELGIIDTSQIGKWMTTKFKTDGNAEFLEPGDYIMYIETSTGVGTGPGGDVAFYFGEDLSVPQPDEILQLWLEGSWGWGQGNPSFKLIIAANNWEGNDGVIIAVEETNSEIENAFTLSRNFPNPASELTEISYIVTEHSNIRFEVYDVTGKLIHALEEGYKLPGKYQIIFNVSNYEPGIYYYSVTTNANKLTRKMVVLH